MHALRLLDESCRPDAAFCCETSSTCSRLLFALKYRRFTHDPLLAGRFVLILPRQSCKPARAAGPSAVTVRLLRELCASCGSSEVAVRLPRHVFGCSSYSGPSPIASGIAERLQSLAEAPNDFPLPYAEADIYFHRGALRSLALNRSRYRLRQIGSLRESTMHLAPRPADKGSRASCPVRLPVFCDLAGRDCRGLIAPRCSFVIDDCSDLCIAELRAECGHLCCVFRSVDRLTG